MRWWETVMPSAKERMNTSRSGDWEREARVLLKKKWEAGRERIISDRKWAQLGARGNIVKGDGMEVMMDWKCF